MELRPGGEIVGVMGLDREGGAAEFAVGAEVVGDADFGVVFFYQRVDLAGIGEKRVAGLYVFNGAEGDGDGRSWRVLR